MLWRDVRHADLFVPGRSGTLRGVSNADASETLLEAFRPAGATSIGGGAVPLTPHLVGGEAWRGIGPTMSAPVFSTAGLEGFILVQRFAGMPDLTQQCLKALTTLANGIGELLRSAKLRTDHSATKSTWREQDLAKAREVQRALLPSLMEPNSGGIRVTAEYHPAFPVGGDFYDFVDLGRGRMVAAIGDVAGKGVSGALTMATLSAELRRLTAVASGPADLLTRLSHSPAAQMQDDRFATVACVLVDVPRGVWIIANAGHVQPILRRRNGDVCLIGPPSGLPIGFSQAGRYTEETISAAPDDILILATDGAFEGRPMGRDPRASVGHSWLISTIEHGPHDISELSRRIVNSAVCSAGTRDDVALLALQLPKAGLGPVSTFSTRRRGT